MSDESAPKSKPGKLNDPKQLVTLIAAITALVTAATSLVKAVDKSVEQASYETLSKHILDLQEDNAAMHKSLDAMASAPSGPASAAPSSSSVVATAPVPSASGSFPKSKVLAGAHPVSASKCPVGDPLCDLGLPPPPPKPSPRPPMAAPPPWGAVKAKADQMPF